MTEQLTSEVNELNIHDSSSNISKRIVIDLGVPQWRDLTLLDPRHDIDDVAYFETQGVALVTPQRCKTQANKENIEPKVDLSSHKELKQLSLFKPRSQSRLAERARRRSQQITIEDQSDTIKKPMRRSNSVTRPLNSALEAKSLTSKSSSITSVKSNQNQPVLTKTTTNTSEPRRNPIQLSRRNAPVVHGLVSKVGNSNCTSLSTNNTSIKNEPLSILRNAPMKTSNIHSNIPKKPLISRSNSLTRPLSLASSSRVPNPPEISSRLSTASNASTGGKLLNADNLKRGSVKSRDFGNILRVYRTPTHNTPKKSLTIPKPFIGRRSSSRCRDYDPKKDPMSSLNNSTPLKAKDNMPLEQRRQIIQNVVNRLASPSVHRQQSSSRLSNFSSSKGSN